MKMLAALLVLTVVVGTDAPASAKGCIKGAIVGGVAGHMVGHGAAGAAAGCVIGHHEANKHARERTEQYRASGNSSDRGYDGPAAASRQY